MVVLVMVLVIVMAVLSVEMVFLVNWLKMY